MTAFPSVTYGTVAGLVTQGVVSVTNSGGNFTLNASGNASPTTFNFGTGTVSGADAASSAGITYSGVTTYVTSNHNDTVTLSIATQNVTGGASGNNTINLGALAYTGTLAFGASGADTVNATVGGDISGGTITSGGAAVALVLSGADAETMSTEEYNLFNATSITGSSFGGNTITFSDAGAVTANANVGNYNLSTAGNIITLTDAVDNVTGAAGGDDTVNLAALNYTGTVAFGASGSDIVNVTVGGDISGGTITSGGASVALVFSGAGTETMSTEEYNLFNTTSITGGSFGGDTITYVDAGTVTANANVGNYNLSTAGNTITLTDAADNVTGAAGGDDTVNLAALNYTGTLAFGASGSDTVNVTVGGDISGGTVTSGGAAVALALSGAGAETMSTEEFNLFNATSITGGSFGGDTITFSDAGTVTANANVGNYKLSTTGNTITLNNAADNVTGAASGNDTVNLAALAYTGTAAFGAGGSDVIDLTVGGNISGGTVTSGGATVALVLSGAGTETLTTAEYNLFNATSITGGSFGGDTIAFADAGSVTANANVGNYDLYIGGGTTIHLTNVADNVTDSGANGGDSINLGGMNYTGTITLGAGATDQIDLSPGHSIAGGTINSGGAPVSLFIIGSGTETISNAELNLFQGTGITTTAGTNNTLIVNPVVNSAFTLTDSQLAGFTNIQNLQIGNVGNATQNITLGTDFSVRGLTALSTSASTGSIMIDASATTTAAQLGALSLGTGINITIIGGTGGDIINATILTAATLNVTSNGADHITFQSFGGSGAATLVANGVDTVDLSSNHANGHDTVTLYQTAIGTHVANWMSNDTLDLSIANFTGGNTLYGNSGTISTIAAQTAHTENIVAYSGTQASHVGDNLYDMGATTFANAAALATYLNSNPLTFASGTVPAAGASLLFEYDDGNNAHLALVHVANGATSTAAATVVDIVELIGVFSTANLHNIHLV